MTTLVTFICTCTSRHCEFCLELLNAYQQADDSIQIFPLLFYICCLETSTQINVHNIKKCLMIFNVALFRMRPSCLYYTNIPKFSTILYY